MHRVHDAFLIAAPLNRLEDDIAAMRDMMTKAGRAVTGGLDIRTDAEVVRWPGRYMDDRGKAMWAKVMKSAWWRRHEQISSHNVSRRRDGSVPSPSMWCCDAVTPSLLINIL